MGTRIRLARFLLKLGDLIHSLPVAVMRPDDLVEFSRLTYARPKSVDDLAQDAVLESGLSRDELTLLAALPETRGDLLLLGVGGGREAVPLAQMGFRVTGVDYVAAMVQRAMENAARYGICIDGLVQEISALDVPAGAYDVVWLSRSMYSCVPTRARRVEMVRRIARALKPGGFFLLQFHWDPRNRMTRMSRLLHRLVAVLTLGNTAYEKGDMLWGDVEFIHAFASEDAVRSELEEGGLPVLWLRTERTSIRGGAVCRKGPNPDHGPESKEDTS